MPDSLLNLLTFLFTDIEGSTRRWEDHPEAMRTALIRHDALLKEALEREGGTIFKRVGDSFCAVFEQAEPALLAALAIQRVVLQQDWSEIGSLHVRVALYTGEAEQRDGDYFGPTLNRVSRLLGLAQGGYILLPQVTRDLLLGGLPPGVALLDLGEQRLKDIQQGERVFQVLAPELPSKVLQLRSAEERQHNLPLPRSPLVGRRRERAELRALLLSAETSLLTLVGAGGTGKTRLALHVASEALDSFADGVYFVGLAALSDPALLISSIARVLGVSELGHESLRERLVAFLKPRQILLLLDNFEQVIEAAQEVSGLLALAPGLKVLVTSREVLRLSAELVYGVLPLSTPAEDKLLTAEVAASEAAQMFVVRAQAVRKDFALSDANAAVVGQICRILQGLPLAIELAAARIRWSPPAELLAQLLQHSRLSVLTGGSRDLPERQQTIRTAIGWSYVLLSAPEQALFRRLGVFAGGWSQVAAEALEAARGGTRGDVLDTLVALMDKSLISPGSSQEDGLRFEMLDMIREYALEQLDLSGEAAALRAWHAHYYLALVERAEPELTRAQQGLWLQRMEREHDNLRAALAWLIERQQPEEALRFVAATWKFWQFHAHFQEGLQAIQAALSLQDASGAAPQGSARARALWGLGWLAYDQAGMTVAARHFAESLALARALGDLHTVGLVLHGTSMIAQLQGNARLAKEQFEESLAIFRRIGDQEEIAWSLRHLSSVAIAQGDLAETIRLLEECLASFRRIGHQWGLILVLTDLGWIKVEQERYQEAAGEFHEVLALARAINNPRHVAGALHFLGRIALEQGEHAQAQAYLEESVAYAREVEDHERIKWNLAHLGRAALAQGRAEQAALLFEQALELARAHQDRYAMAMFLSLKGYSALSSGQPGLADGAYRESLALFPMGHLRDRDCLTQCLDGLALLAAQHGGPGLERAARLRGAVEQIQRSSDVRRPALERDAYQALLDPLLLQLKDPAYAAAWAEGQAMELDALLRYALEQSPTAWS